MNGQPTPSTSQPPSIGASAPEIAPTAAQVPTARPRASPVKEALRVARLLGSSIAAPSPCSARPARKISQARRRRAQHRGGGEQDDAPEHHPPPPVKVARRAAEQQQGGERQGEGVDHPLHLGGGGAEAAPDRGQGDVEHRAVDEGEARGEDAGGEDQPRMPGSRPARPGRRGAVAGSGQGKAHGSEPKSSRQGGTMNARFRGKGE